MVLSLERARLIQRTPGAARSIKLIVPPESLPVLHRLDANSSKSLCRTTRYQPLLAVTWARKLLISHLEFSLLIRIMRWQTNTVDLSWVETVFPDMTEGLAQAGDGCVEGPR
jgi:hypothetical protein